MRKYLLLLLMSTLFMAPAAYAHTMDKSTLFTDVPETTSTIQDIMVLHSIGLLGYNGKDMALNPTDNLSRKDFASWVGGFFGLEGATVDELAQAAQKEEYISSLEGDLTYKEINTALFHHKLELENPDATMTKEEYIAFLMEHLDYDMGGHTLLQMGGYAEGPTGTIEDVVTGDETGIIINGKTYMLSGHPRIFAESTDAKSWVGQQLERSIFTTTGDHHHGHDGDQEEGHGDHAEGHGDSHEHEASASDEATLQYVQISTAQVVKEDAKEVQSSNATTKEQQTAATDDTTSNTVWMIAILIVLAAIFALVFVKRKK
ncbi:LPXTG cell wall anchor domain-containing protein [Lysinibacillus sphaericus]|uniref:LPXTG cell wall anchor domain-containing protein n=1 Tax=Lysinibacillus sphaericus TaxID=1421 RepID=UPI00055E49F2|nr:LPXTG cell wall anchor domain-containing protein [Lysinibacillus sphaericus]